ncbi:MAG TPA: TetR/AcrR family transcriptional regulator [Acidobacteriaceae bacterium]
MAVQAKGAGKPSKRDAILEALLEIVVERGFHDAPMSLIVRRSGASAGVIYHYFASKDAMIAALYERIRARKIEAFLGEFDAEREPCEVFVQTFVKLYGFYREHQREMRFYELCEQAGFACTEKSDVKDERAAAFARRFAGKSHGGVLKDWPYEVIGELTFGLVSRLASQKKKLAAPMLKEIAESTWEMVKA